jgi:hypothetical protein
LSSDNTTAAIDAAMAKSGSCAVATESVIDGVEAAVVQAVADALQCTDDDGNGNY